MKDMPCERCVFIPTPGGRCHCRAVSFVVPGEPASKARARFTNYGSKVRAYTPAKTLTAEAGVRAAYLAVASPSVYDLGRTDKPRGKCEHCGGEFAYYHSQRARRFCTQTCHIEWRRARRERTCKECGVLFDHAHPTSAQTYCSIACSAKATHVPVTCVRCGMGFSKPRSLNRHGNSYCSDECKVTYWREQRKSAAKGTCHDCGGPTTKKHYKRCRDCAYAAGGRWADRDKATCDTCHQFIPDGQRCPKHPLEDS